MESATLIVLLALGVYLWFTGRVGGTRNKYEVEAPECTGHPQWERLFRVQQNTLEQLIVFIPATYAFAWYVSPRWVWLPGAAFILGRLVYAQAYLKDPAKRTTGMVLTFFSNIALVLVTLIAVAMELL